MEKNEGYEVCYDGVQEKFLQNATLLTLLKSTFTKILGEVTMDQLWSTETPLRDPCALNTSMWNSTGWLSQMLLNICDEL